MSFLTRIPQNVIITNRKGCHRQRSGFPKTVTIVAAQFSRPGRLFSCNIVASDGVAQTKEKKEEREELTEEILESTTSEKAPGMTVTEAQDQVKNMLNKLGLIEEEIKGAAIDELK